MAPNVHRIIALVGSLSHSHYTCLSRNILAGEKGCTCADTRGDGDKCNCKASPFLQKDGTYDIDLLRSYDPEWADHVNKGNAIEILVPEMDVEEPEAALVISIALNKRNEAAMETSHTEIMNTLVGLCKPEPSAVDGVVQFEPIRNHMVDLYGVAVDHPDFHHCFRLVMDAGGSESPHMKDLHDFTSIHVNSKLRKLRIESYAVVTVVGHDLPKFKNAMIKHAWKQPPVRGWCPLPVPLSYRADATNKLQLCGAVHAMEDSMLVLSSFAAAVADKVPRNSIIKWKGEVDIGLVSKLIATPAKHKDMTRAEQEVDLETKCGDMLALKVDGLLERCKGTWNDYSRQLPAVATGNDIMKRALKVLKDPLELIKVKTAAAAANEAKNPAVAGAPRQDLLPKIRELDHDGKPMFDTEVREKIEHAIETVEWTPWVAHAATCIEKVHCKAILRTAVCQVELRSEAAMAALKVAIVRKGKEVWCKATEDIAAGKLVVPLSFRKDASMIDPFYDAQMNIHPHAVNVLLARPSTALEKLSGIENEEVETTISVQPELRLPKPSVEGKTNELDQADSLHPFWFLPRRKDKDELTNCVMTRLSTTIVVAVTPQGKCKELGLQHTTTFRVEVPCIVNSHDIKADERIVVEWNLATNKNKPEPRARTWADDVANQEKKRRMKEAPAKKPKA